MSKMYFNVADFGAAGVAEPSEELHLTHLKYLWLEYEPGLKVRIYRAREGEELDSTGIQKAIDAAHEAGGGTVEVGPGDYLIGPIELRSRVNLHLQPGARLWGSPDIADYQLREGDKLPRYTLANGFNRASEGLTRDYRRLISAYEARDCGITGQGQISAQSPAFVIPWMNSKPTNLLSLIRPQDTFIFFRCEDVWVENIRVLNTPSWSMVFDTCRGVRVQGVKLHCFDIINSDGIDLVNTSNVTISNCNIHCTDDAICLKNTVPDATMGNIVVTNCVVRTLCNGFKIGTDSMGNFQDITVNNMAMHAPETLVGDRGGINLCALDGGFVRNINVSNIVMRNMFCPFYLYQTARTPQQKALGREPIPGTMERISITNLQCDGTRYPAYIVGHPERPVRDVHLANINVRKTMDFQTTEPTAVPEVPDVYPTPFTFGTRATGDKLPACGLYLRNVEHLTVHDFSQQNAGEDVRELVVQEHCAETTLDGLKLRGV